MGFVCPVCAAPQADGIHLANHLAFTALLGRADHAAWLDEHAPGWDDDSPEALAERVAPEAPEIDVEHATEAAAEPTAEGSSGPDVDVPDPHDGHDQPATPESPAEPDPEVGAVIEAARELTRKRREDETE